MNTILTLTDSLSSSAGGLAHASLQLAAAVSDALPGHRHLLLAQKDKNEIDHGLHVTPNLRILKEPCYRNNIYPISLGLNHTIHRINPDIVHLRGLWRQTSLACLKWKQNFPQKPLIVQTAGMLDPWAIKKNSIVKQAYFNFIESKLIHICDVLHVTSPSERLSVLHQGVPAQKVLLVEEGVSIPSKSDFLPANKLSNNEKKTLLFLSRIHPVKGLDILLESLSLVRPRNWNCKIIGMGDTTYISRLKEKVVQLNLENIVTFSGPVLGELKSRAFLDASAFVLPSHSESFGIAIAEALSWQLPVITTHQTPWSVISEKKMGWYVADTVNGISEAIYNLIQTSHDERCLMGLRGYEYVSERYSWNELGKKMAKYYAKAINISADDDS